MKTEKPADPAEPLGTSAAEAAPQREKAARAKWVKPVAIAACVVAVTAVAFAVWLCQSAPAGNLVRINEVKCPSFIEYGTSVAATASFCNKTNSKLFKYYGITLPVEQVLPSFKLQKSSADERGFWLDCNGKVSLDGNQFNFEKADKSQSFCVTLAKASLCAGIGPQDTAAFPLKRKLAFSEIKGRELVIIHYHEFGNRQIYYTEFMQGKIAFYIMATNMKQADFIKGLSSIVKSATPQKIGGVHVLHGKVEGDDFDGLFQRTTIKLDAGQEYHGYITTYKVKPSVSRWFSPNDKVTVTYRDTPISIGCIWPQQYISVK